MTKYVRPVVTFIFAAGITGGFFLGMVSAEAFIGVAGIAVGFWFQARESSKITKPPEE